VLLGAILSISCQFHSMDSLLRTPHVQIWLVFEGLHTVANITLNGQPLAFTSRFFLASSI